MLFQSQIIALKKLLPWNKIRDEKRALRTIMEQKRRIMTNEQVETESRQIISMIEQMDEFQQAQTIMVYYPVRHEVNLLELVRKYKDQKQFIFPVTHRRYIEPRLYQGDEQMKKGKFGIPEPQGKTYTGPIDLILIPGVAFDKKGNRLGRGGGYYDRFLRYKRSTTQIGVAYSFQIRKHSIPHNFWDHRLNGVVTPHDILRH